MGYHGFTRGRSPSQMRRGIDPMAPKPPPPEIDPALRPALDSGSGGSEGLGGADGDIVAEWLEHIRTGRIEVR